MRRLFAVFVLSFGLLASGCSTPVMIGASGNEGHGPPLWSGAAFVSGSASSLQGRPISSSAPSTNDVLTWTGSTWAPQAGGGGGGTTGVTGWPHAVWADGVLSNPSNLLLSGPTTTDFYIGSPAVAGGTNSVVIQTGDASNGASGSVFLVGGKASGAGAGSSGGILFDAEYGSVGRIGVIPASSSVSGHNEFSVTRGSFDLGNSSAPWANAYFSGNVTLPVGLATSATTGLLVLSTCAGTPTGAAPEGSMIVDTTNHKLCVRDNGAWHSITLP